MGGRVSRASVKSRKAAALLLALALLGGAAAIAAAAAITQQGDLRVEVNGKLSPKALPRGEAAPVSVSVSGRVSTTDESTPPQLRQLAIEINRHGRFDYSGLPVCAIGRIQPASDSRALAACRASLVGQGRFAGTFTLPGSAPYPISGRLLLFNGTEGDRPVLLGHIFSPKPFATSFVIVFKIAARRHGAYGTVLSADVAKALGDKRNLTAIEMTLSRRYTAGGRRHSYISAACPAPAGFPGGVFDLARTSFSFAGGAKLSSTLSSECKVRG
jgi:hypothetical protein